jgi:exoribonuclease-2
MRQQNRLDLDEMARFLMREKYLQPDFSDEELQQAGAMSETVESDTSARDLRALDWLSIDNDDSRDLDQISVAEDLGEGRVRVLVAIADVDARVSKESPIDLRARFNTTTIYTVAQTFPMLPERLCYELTSLGEGRDRAAVVVAFEVTAEGALEKPEIFRAVVRNRAKLTYNGVTAWLEGKSAPETITGRPEMQAQLRLQDAVAQRLRVHREERGALDLETVDARPILRNGSIVDLKDEPQNRAQELIEDLMIAVNGVTAQFLEQQGIPTLRRIVREPLHWRGIVRVAAGFDHNLPSEPDSRALSAFLRERRQADPLRFPDLSLLIIKLMGPGEYVLHRPGATAAGHFGLAVQDYSHSTAPNRRYPDMVTQRLLKATLEGTLSPYPEAELAELAEHCTFKEDMADRVERRIRRTAAAMMLTRSVGDWFKGIVTAVTPKGVYVRILRPPVEGMIGARKRKIEVGDRVTVRLTEVDIDRGYLSFAL